MVDILEAGAQFEACLSDEAFLFALFPLQAFLLDQEAESVEEREGFVCGGLFLLLREGLRHAGQAQVAQACEGLYGSGHGIVPLVEVLRPAQVLVVLGQRVG